MQLMDALAWKEVTGPFMMDHTPLIANECGRWVGHAFANGYIRALIQAVYA